MTSDIGADFLILRSEGNTAAAGTDHVLAVAIDACGGMAILWIAGNNHRAVIYAGSFASADTRQIDLVSNDFPELIHMDDLYRERTTTSVSDLARDRCRVR